MGLRRVRSLGAVGHPVLDARLQPTAGATDANANCDFHGNTSYRDSNKGVAHMDADPAQPDRITVIYTDLYGGSIVYSHGYLHFESDRERDGAGAGDCAADIYSASDVHPESDALSDTSSVVSAAHDLATG